MRHVLVLVHPGSACGSANFNLGRDEARAARQGLTRGINTWDGDFLVIDGALSSELSSYPMLEESILKALARSAAAGHVAERAYGCDSEDYDQTKCIQDLVRRHGYSPSEATFEVTGAWLHPEKEGCVGSVIQTLEALGFKATPCDHAVFIDPDACDSEDNSEAAHESHS